LEGFFSVMKLKFESMKKRRNQRNRKREMAYLGMP
jgi:hypothetical protein